MPTFSSIILEITVATKSKKTHGVGKVDEKQLLNLLTNHMTWSYSCYGKGGVGPLPTKMTGVVIFPPGKKYDRFEQVLGPTVCRKVIVALCTFFSNS